MAGYLKRWQAAGDVTEPAVQEKGSRHRENECGSQHGRQAIGGSQDPKISEICSLCPRSVHYNPDVASLFKEGHGGSVAERPPDAKNYTLISHLDVQIKHLDSGAASTSFTESDRNIRKEEISECNSKGKRPSKLLSSDKTEEGDLSKTVKPSLCPTMSSPTTKSERSRNCEEASAKVDFSKNDQHADSVQAVSLSATRPRKVPEQELLISRLRVRHSKVLQYRQNKLQSNETSSIVHPKQIGIGTATQSCDSQIKSYSSVSPRTKPSDNQSSRNQPSESQSLENQSSNNQPLDSQSSVSQSLNNQPLDSQLSDSQSMNNEPLDSQSWNNRQTDSQSSNNQPSDSQSLKNQPLDSQSSSNQPSDSRTSNNQPSDSEPLNNQPLDSQSSNNQLSDSESSKNQPSDSRSLNYQPLDSQSSSNQPLDSQSMNNEPLDSQSWNNHPTDSQSSNNQPTDSRSLNNQPSGSQLLKNQPLDRQSSKNQPSESQPLNNQLLNCQSSINQLLYSQSSNNQPSDSQLSNNQSLDNQSLRNLPLDSQPSGCLSSNNQPLDRQSSDSQLSCNQSSDSQPLASQSLESQSSDKQLSCNQPSDSQSLDNQLSHNQPLNSQSSDNQSKNQLKKNTGNKIPVKEFCCALSRSAYIIGEQRQCSCRFKHGLGYVVRSSTVRQLAVELGDVCVVKDLYNSTHIVQTESTSLTQLKTSVQPVKRGQPRKKNCKDHCCNKEEMQTFTMRKTPVQPVKRGRPRKKNCKEHCGNKEEAQTFNMRKTPVQPMKRGRPRKKNCKEHCGNKEETQTFTILPVQPVKRGQPPKNTGKSDGKCEGHSRNKKKTYTYTMRKKSEEGGRTKEEEGQPLKGEDESPLNSPLISEMHLKKQTDVKNIAPNSDITEVSVPKHPLKEPSLMSSVGQAHPDKNVPSCDRFKLYSGAVDSDRSAIILDVAPGCSTSSGYGEKDSVQSKQKKSTGKEDRCLTVDESGNTGRVHGGVVSEAWNNMSSEPYIHGDEECPHECTEQLSKLTTQFPLGIQYMITGRTSEETGVKDYSEKVMDSCPDTVENPIQQYDEEQSVDSMERNKNALHKATDKIADKAQNHGCSKDFCCLYGGPADVHGHQAKSRITSKPASNTEAQYIPGDKPESPYKTIQTLDDTKSREGASSDNTKKIKKSLQMQKKDKKDEFVPPKETNSSTAKTSDLDHVRSVSGQDLKVPAQMSEVETNNPKRHLPNYMARPNSLKRSSVPMVGSAGVWSALSDSSEQTVSFGNPSSLMAEKDHSNLPGENLAKNIYQSTERSPKKSLTTYTHRGTNPGSQPRTSDAEFSHFNDTSVNKGIEEASGMVSEDCTGRLQDIQKETQQEKMGQWIHPEGVKRSLSRMRSPFSSATSSIRQKESYSRHY
ncbi:uncharacterized protein [Dendropsophus ebraccatus]|uniref:uncharacterized protein n=1 Tax=Dendropsophus ebraccatus TaxID=150705 RepID=UPI003831A94C